MHQGSIHSHRNANTLLCLNRVCQQQCILTSSLPRITYENVNRSKLNDWNVYEANRKIISLERWAPRPCAINTKYIYINRAKSSKRGTHQCQTAVGSTHRITSFSGGVLQELCAVESLTDDPIVDADQCYGHRSRVSS